MQTDSANIAITNETRIQTHTGILGIAIAQAPATIVTKVFSPAAGLRLVHSPYFPFAFAHLAFCAAAILALPSSLTLLRFRAARCKGAECSVSSARNFSSRIISASRLCTIVVRSMK
jgi:hypothetical protein